LLKDTTKANLPAYLHTFILLMLNGKHGSWEYQLLKSSGLTSGGGGATNPFLGMVVEFLHP